MSNPVELININTNEVLIFKSLRDTAQYVQETYPSVSLGSLSVIARNGKIYKGTFKLRYIDKDN
jgi:hypothetical protein